MCPAPDEFAIVGLGKIGGALAAQALAKGYRVVGLDKQEIPAELTSAGLVAASSLSHLQNSLRKPRIAFLYVPAGPVVDEILQELENVLSEGDVVVDGSNSYWGDSLRR
jgi:6-phosphogluconate dehydrogenase